MVELLEASAPFAQRTPAPHTIHALSVRLWSDCQTVLGLLVASAPNAQHTATTHTTSALSVRPQSCSQTVRPQSDCMRFWRHLHNTTPGSPPMRFLSDHSLTCRPKPSCQTRLLLSDQTLAVRPPVGLPEVSAALAQRRIAHNTARAISVRPLSYGQPTVRPQSDHSQTTVLQSAHSQA